MVRTRVFSAALAVAAAIGGTQPARADEVPKPRKVRFGDRPFALQAVLGVGTHVGLVGLQGHYTVVEALALGAGAGSNSSGSLQLAGFLNFRPLIWADHRTVNAFGILGAYSTGPYDAWLGVGGNDNYERSWAVERAHWLSADLGFEHQMDSGLSIRTALGAAFMVNPGSAFCRASGSGEPVPCATGDVVGAPPDQPLITLTVAMGYAF